MEVKHKPCVIEQINIAEITKIEEKIASHLQTGRKYLDSFVVGQTVTLIFVDEHLD